MRDKLEQLGYAPLPIKEFKRGDELLARFFFVQDPDGYKIEILHRAGHYQ
jgi:lactoylglutathione lyase